MFGGDAVSDTPRTDAAAFGTDDESLNILFGIRELPRYVVPVDFARQLERELAAVTAERDVLKADLCAFAVDMERQLSAVTAERDAANEKLRTMASPAVQGVLAKMSAPPMNQVMDDMRKNLEILDRVKSERDASQQEARRLRESLDAVQPLTRL